MELLLYIFFFSLPSLVETVRDPIDGLLPAEVDAAELECEPLSSQGAERLSPGEIPEPERGDSLDRRAVICRERIMPSNTRRAQDNAILMDLRRQAKTLASVAADTERTWLVEVYYPRPAVAQKINFAVKAALLERDFTVTDRSPALAAGDIEVIGRLSHDRAWPVACLRYRATGSVGPKDALLAVVLRDARETILHAGTCIDGRWRWLR
jgi:hypothetical protein